MFEENKSFQPDLSGYDYIIGRQLKPEIPVNILDEMRKCRNRINLDDRCN